MRLITLFFSVCICLFSTAMSARSDETYRASCKSSIMTINYVDVLDENTTAIFLNNGSQWIYDGGDLFNGPMSWQCGDRVNLVYVYSEGYYLQNASYQGLAPVTLINNNPDALIVNCIQNIIKNDKSSTNTIVLDDKTRWHVGSWSSGWMKDWQVGDRIVASPQEFVFGKADHLLINFDREKSHLQNVRARLLSTSQEIPFEDVNQREARNDKIRVAKVWKTAKSLVIELENKVILKCSLPKAKCSIGDTLEIMDSTHDIEFKNLRNKTKVKATIVNLGSSDINLPTIQKVSTTGKKIVLSDGSIWFSAKDVFKKWKIGERLMAVPLHFLASDTSTHVLINVEKESETLRSFSATLVR